MKTISNYFKLSIASIAVIIAVFTPTLVMGTNLMAEDISYALVVDTKDADDGVPKKFRTSNFDPKKDTAADNPDFDADEINFVSLKDLKIAASAQFSEASLKNILRHLKGKITVVDLRKEPHGFVNGVPVSWYLPGNIMNWQRSSREAQNMEKELLNYISKQDTIILHKLEKDKNIDAPSVRYIPLTPTKVKLVESEQELTKRYNLNYVRFTVRDKNKPDPSEVDAFIAFVNTVPKDTWVYLHCRAGSGRSTTFMAMYDMIKNANKVSFENILKRQAFIGGKFLYDLPKDKNHWSYNNIKGRLEFLRDFYDYVLDPNGLKTSKWSSWIKSKQ